MFECSRQLLLALLFIFYMFMPGMGIGDSLLLTPLSKNGNTVNITGGKSDEPAETHTFENDSILYTCRYPLPVNSTTYYWYVDRELYDPHNRFGIVRGGLKNLNDWLCIPSISIMLNDSIIECRVETGGGQTYNKTIVIILQGIPSPVKDLLGRVDGSMLNVNWMAPDLIINEILNYTVEVVNLINGTSYKYYTNYTSFEIPLTPLKTIKCLDFNVTISATNILGSGEEATLFNVNSSPRMIEFYVIKNNINKFDLMVITSSPVCTISRILIRNLDLNDTHLENNNFENFSLVQATPERHWYQFLLDLKNRYNYEVQIELDNEGHEFIFNLSTHAVSDITVRNVSSNELRVEVHNFDHSNYFVGAFIIMLYCGNTSLCEDIDHDSSIYLLTYDMNTTSYEGDYLSGYYLVYAYDIEANGSLISSENVKNRAYSIQKNLVLLTEGLASKTSMCSIQDQCCTLNYDNYTVGSTCHLRNTDELGVQQQLILQSINSNGALEISTTEDLNKPICLMANEKFYTGIALLITSYPEKRSTLPIGRRNILLNETNNEALVCEISSSTTSTQCTTCATLQRGSICFLTVISFMTGYILNERTMI